MNAASLRSSIEALQEELNQLTGQGFNELTSQHILALSAKLDVLIVQYLKMVG